MTHYSRVSHKVFESIKAGKKIIEPRLNDHAHRRIRLGDLIIVTDRTTGKELVTKVVGVLRYSSFDELFAMFSPQHFGADDKQQLLGEMSQWYSASAEAEHGVLGIKLHVMQKT